MDVEVAVDVEVDVLVDVDVDVEVEVDVVVDADVEVEVDVDMDEDVEVGVVVELDVDVLALVLESSGVILIGSQPSPLLLPGRTGRLPKAFLVLQADSGSSLTHMTSSVVVLQTLELGSGLGCTTMFCRLLLWSSNLTVHRFSGSKSSHELSSWSVRLTPSTKMAANPP